MVLADIVAFAEALDVWPLIVIMATFTGGAFLFRKIKGAVK